MGDATPGQIVLDYIRKQAEQSMRSKSLNSIRLWFLLPGGCLDILICLLLMIDCDLSIVIQNKLFALNSFPSMTLGLGILVQ